MHARYFEGFKVGDTFETRAVTLTEGQMVDFSMATHNRSTPIARRPRKVSTAT